MLRFIFVSCSLFSLVLCVCQNDWVRYENSCYYFADLPSNRVTWHQALQECSWNESRLVIVETKEENDFIKRHLAQLHPQSEDQFWTFGNDIHFESSWNWGETPYKITTTFWFPGEPNQNGGEEDCLSYYTRYNFAWNDEHCDRPEYYICETEDQTNNIIG